MKIATITILLASILTIHAKERKSETRTASMTIPIEESQEVILNMKNTALQVEAWDKKEVSIVAIVEMNSSMTDKREEFLSNWQKIVAEGVSSFGSAIRITSAYESSKEVNNKTFLGVVVSTNIRYDKAYTITYRIKVPGGNALKIDGSYEDVSLSGDFKTLEMDLYSADFEADNIIHADLELKYGSATLTGIKKGDLTLYENKLEVKEIGELDLKAKYAEVELEQIGTLDLDTYESDVVMDNVTTLEGNMKYGELEIKEKGQTIDIELYEVDLELEEVASLRMQSRYSNLTSTRIDALTIDSSYEDEFKIEQLNTISSNETRYGKYFVRKLMDSFELKGYEDDVTIYAVTSATSKISLDGKYVETEINLQDVPAFLDVFVTYGDLSFDEAKMDVSRRIEEGNSKELVAKTKGIGDSGLKVKVRGYEMDLTLDE